MCDDAKKNLFFFSVYQNYEELTHNRTHGAGRDRDEVVHAPMTSLLHFQNLVIMVVYDNWEYHDNQMIIIMTTFVVGLHVHVKILLESLLDHVALTKAGVP